jgi:hypothetical protein
VLAALKRTPVCAQVVDAPSVKAAAVGVALESMRYSMAKGACESSSSVATATELKPLPRVVTVVASCVPAPITKSPVALGVMLPEVGAVPEPLFPDTASAAVATNPVNSATIKDSCPALDPALNITLSGPAAFA